MKLTGEASQAAYQAALAQGVQVDTAKALARDVRRVLKETWTSAYLAEAVVGGRIQRLVEDEIHRRREVENERQRVHEKAIQDVWDSRRKRLEDEVERLQRERTELAVALAEATGETLTTITRLYTITVAEAA